MNDRPHNPDDLAFLISQGLDDGLSAEQRRRLDEALDASTELRQEAEDFAAVDGLIGRWAQRRVDLTWDATAGLIGAEVRGEGDDLEIQKIDALLGRWGRSQAASEGFDVSSAVMKQIRGERSLAGSHRWALRIGGPLAMAAAVALVVFGTTWFEPPERPTVVVEIRSTIGESAAMSEPPRMVVSFARTDAESVARDSSPAGIGFITLGAEPIVATGDASSM
jgi:hypothetical protein